MTALLILNYDVDDAESLMRYREQATPVLLGPGRGTLLSSTSGTVALGETPATGTHTVVLSFDSVAAARRLYDSAEYQQLLEQRLRATRPVAAMIVPVEV